MTTQTPDSKPRALIAMSGGVDSSVAAWLMQQAGYDCTGITMRLTRNETLGQSGFHTCCSEKDIEDAAEVAFAMDIPYEVLDFTADFREQIIEKFVRVYEAGGTPNPCIDCNKYMKFRHLLDWARAHGMEYVVTGHYARVEQDEATGRWLLKKGLDEGKDQSYVLYNLTQEQLAHIRLPLGALHKTEVRKIAQEHSFINAQKHDSQDICFVPDGDYVKFMEQYTGKRYPAGDFLAFLAMISWGLYSATVKKIEEWNYPTAAVTRRIYFYGIIFLIPVLILQHAMWDMDALKRPEVISNFLFLGVGASAVGFFLWNLSTKWIGAVKTSVYIYVSPVVTVVLSMFVLDEKMTVASVSGSILILIGLIISQKRKKIN